MMRGDRLAPTSRPYGWRLDRADQLLLWAFKLGRVAAGPIPDESVRSM